MNNLHDHFFSPLGKEYCAYFKYLMYLSFVTLALTVVNLVRKVLSSGKTKLRLDLHLSNVIQAGLVYFVNRLMYSMCVVR